MHDSDTTIEPWWLKLADIVGFEDEDSDSGDDDDSDSGDEEDEDSEDDSDDSDDSEDSDEDDSEEDEDKKTVSQKDIVNLKSALRKERMDRKKAQRELKRLKGRPKSDTDKNGDGKDEDENKGPSEREVKLAARLRDQAVDSVITRIATRMNFVDIDDALRLVNRKEIDVQQDDEDPTEIDIDEEAVEDALKELTKKKKYLVASGDKVPRSGSKMGGKNKKSGLSDDQLRDKYKALRR